MSTSLASPSSSGRVAGHPFRRSNDDAPPSSSSTQAPSTPDSSTGGYQPDRRVVPSLRAKTSSSALNAVLFGPAAGLASPVATSPTTAAGQDGQSGGKAKTAAWMKKLRRWRSKDELWGCAGETHLEEEDEFLGDDCDAGLEREDACMTMDGFAISTNEKQLPKIPSNRSSGSSSVRSSLRSSTLSQTSSSLGGARTASTTISSPSAGSVASLGSRADVLGKEHEQGIAAMSSYLERQSSTASSPISHPLASPLVGGRHALPVLRHHASISMMRSYSASTAPPSPISPGSVSASSSAAMTRSASSGSPVVPPRSAERQGSLAYARQRAASATHSPTSPTSLSSLRSEPPPSRLASPHRDRLAGAVSPPDSVSSGSTVGAQPASGLNVKTALPALRGSSSSLARSPSVSTVDSTSSTGHRLLGPISLWPAVATSATSKPSPHRHSPSSSSSPSRPPLRPRANSSLADVKSYRPRAGTLGSIGRGAHPTSTKAAPPVPQRRGQMANEFGAASSSSSETETDDDEEVDDDDEKEEGEDVLGRLAQVPRNPRGVSDEQRRPPLASSVSSGYSASFGSVPAAAGKGPRNYDFI